MTTSDLAPTAEVGEVPYQLDPTDALDMTARLHARSRRDPERELRLAVLEQARAELLCTDRHRRADWCRQRARDWFESTEHDWPCSFLGICEALGLDADRTRATVLRDAPVVQPASPMRLGAGRPPFYVAVAERVRESLVPVSTWQLRAALNVSPQQLNDAIGYALELGMVKRVGAGLYVSTMRRRSGGGGQGAAT